MARRKVLKAWRAAIAIVRFLVSLVQVEAQTLNELIASAKKESEIAFIADGTTFGGPESLVGTRGFQQEIRPECAHQLDGGTEHGGDGLERLRAMGSERNVVEW